MGWLYLVGAILGGGYFIWTSLLLTFKQTKDTAMKNFFASFIQLGLLLVLIIANGMAPL
jgi:protoheme IX farnesyltransferase